MNFDDAITLLFSFAALGAAAFMVLAVLAELPFYVRQFFNDLKIKKHNNKYKNDK